MKWRIHPRAVLLILVNIILKASCKGKGSLTFLIDDTSSMAGDINQVMTIVRLIKDIVLHEKSSLIDNMVLVTFNDPGIYVRNVTKDPNEFKRALNAVKAHNEMKQPYLDCWEPSMKGLLLALETSQDNSYVFVFTDAPAKDYNESKSVIEMCQKKQTQILTFVLDSVNKSSLNNCRVRNSSTAYYQMALYNFVTFLHRGIKIVFVLTGKLCSTFKDQSGPEAIDVYSEIAVACSGLAITVQKEEVNKMYGPIKEIIKGNKTVITTATIPAGISKKIPFTIDDHTDYVIVYAYGKNVSLKINQRSLFRNYIMSTYNAKAIKLNNAKPGSYYATVKGATRTSVLVVGRTDFFFSHGFSESKPKSLGDTSQTVSADGRVYLSISVTDDQHSVKIVSAQLYDMDGKPIMQKLPLSKISKDFYVTNPFVAPSQRFQVAVNGIVITTGQSINRSSKIPITPSPPKVAPKIERVKERKVNVGETVQLECKVLKGFPAPKITWLYGDNSGTKFSPIVSNSVLVITNAKYKDEGKYKCVAKNEKGTDEFITTLFILDKPKIVSSTSTIYESTEGDASLKIPCIATGRPKPSITWKLEGSVIKPSDKYSTDDGSLIIRNIVLNDTKLYTCEAKNNLGSVSANFKTYIRQKPKISGLGTKQVRVGSPASIECTVLKGEPKPTITWQFMDNSGSKFLQIAGSDEVLHISRVEEKHTGQYKCTAKNVVGMDEHITTIEVQDPPKIVTSVSSTVYQSIEGDAALRIPCVASGLPKPSITWKLNGRVINPSVKYSIEDGTLIIKDPKVNDTNAYTCQAKNKVSTVSATFRTYIRQKPQVSGDAVQQVRTGSSTSIECTVLKGEPKPNITWQFMENSGSKFLQIAGSDEVLHISLVKEKHAGQYKCTAKNVVGMDEHITTIEVQDPPKIVTSVSTTVYQSIEGDAALRIPCVASSLPKPSITWKLNGRVINPSVKYSIEDGTLIIKDPKVNDTNAYTCQAKNKVSTVSATFRTYIRKKPQVSGDAVKQVRIGSSASIQCTVKGEPKPTITWTFSNNHGSNFLPIPGSGQVLHISKVEIKHAGSYKCVAQNSIGSAEHITTIVVQDTPQILSNVSTTYQSTEGDVALRVPCAASGLPKPSITWKLEGRVINPSVKYLIEDGNLIIILPTVNDTNSYTCEAKNENGRVSATFKTYIRQKPQVSGVAAKQVRIGSAASIECKVTKGKPKPTMTWQFMGKGSSKFVIISGTERVLHISSVEHKHAGQYKCVAENSVGRDAHITTLEVQEAPQISGVADKQVRIGSPISIECMIKGTPKPTITWKFMDNFSSKFLQLPETDHVLHISKVEDKHAGRYKCLAQNKVGSDEHVTTLTVEYLPSITMPLNSSTVEGIEGDLALRIPCNVNGVPKPVITWKRNGTTITPNEKYSIEDGALVITKPAADDSASYTCEANNSVGSVSATFEVAVTSHPESFGTVDYVYIKQGETRNLECEGYNNSESQAVKWFVTKENLDLLLSSTSSPMELDSLETTTLSADKGSSTIMPRIITQDIGNKAPYFQIVNASYFKHDGNFTCRVSDKHGNTQTHTYVVDVGIAPEFNSNENVINKWRGEVDIIKSICGITNDVQPEPVVQWTFNGKEITDLSSAGVGRYTCNVSNVHGSILKQFDVKSSACLISRNLIGTPYMPLVLNDEGFWHKLETTDNYMIVEQKEKIILSCPSQKEAPNTFKNFFQKSSVEAICKEGAFIVDDKSYNLAELQCTNSIQPSVIKKKAKCLTETSELIRVGYNIPGFIEAYEVCFDHKANMPLYSRIVMADGNNNGLTTGYNWFTYPGIGNKQTEREFTCKDASSSCCYSKSQLVNAIDFNDGPAKKSTFIDPVNVIPVWLPCDKHTYNSKSPWESINDKVRSQLESFTDDIIVWSGTHTLQEKNGTVIPRYLWKVVKLVDGKKMAMFYVNDPKPTDSDIKCMGGDICDNYKDWFVDDNSIYCCSMPDFIKSFDFHDTDFAESLDTALDNMKKP